MGKRLKIEFYFDVFEKESELEEGWLDLLKAAESACDQAYAPYSNFTVGAALRLEDGSLIIGTNQENGAYPLGLCAERVAFFAAGSQHPDQKITRVAVAAKPSSSLDFSPVTPCGGCRQVMLEYEQKQDQPIPIIFRGKGGQVFKIDSIEDLLPLPFESLNRKNSA